MIPVEYIRSSSASTYKMCQLKYFLSYVLGYHEPSNKKADLGTVVHKVMEILAQIKLARQNKKRFINDEIIGKYSSSDKKLNIQEITDKVYSYYTNAFNHHTWTIADYKTAVKWINMALTEYDEQFNPLNQNIVEPEKRFSLKLEEDWAQNLILNGTIDLITKKDDNTYEIIDYKTGARKDWATGEIKTYEYLQNDFQLRFYHLAVSMLYPEIKDILITIYFIRDGGPFTLSFDRGDLPDTKNNIRHVYDSIRNLMRPEMQQRFHPNKWGSPCKFCHFAQATFDGTEVQPIINKGQGDCYFSKRGDFMTMCEQTNYILDYRDIETVMQFMTRGGHDLTKYKAPGEVQ